MEAKRTSRDELSGKRQTADYEDNLKNQFGFDPFIFSLKEHLPNENSRRIENGEVPTAARIHVATYPSMMQIYKQLSVGYYDLVIADESHRSIYNRYKVLLDWYKVLLDWFDALQIGLTATPTDFIDHNTFELFGCDDGIPTFNYSFDQAVADEHLTNYQVYQAQTNFLNHIPLTSSCWGARE